MVDGRYKTKVQDRNNERTVNAIECSISIIVKEWGKKGIIPKIRYGKVVEGEL